MTIVRSTVRVSAFVVAFIVNVTFVIASQAAGTETLLAIVGKDFILIGADSSVSQSISLTASNLDKIAPLVEPFFYEDKRRRDPRQQQTIVAAVAGDAADADRLVGMLQAYATLQEFQTGLGSDVDYVPGGSMMDGDVDGSSYVPYSYGLSVESVAQLARGHIASALRTRNPSNVCLLIAGMITVPTIKRRAQQSAISSPIQKQVRDAWNENNLAGTSFSSHISTKGATAKAGISASTLSSMALEPRLYWLDEYGSLQQIQYGAHGYGSNFVLSILDQGYRKDMSRDEAIALLRECFQQLRMRYVINSPQPPCIKCVDERGCVLIN